MRAWRMFCDRTDTPQLVDGRVGEDGEWDTQNALVTVTNATSTQVAGLLPYTVYSFRVVAVNALGPSPPSRESYYMISLREGERSFDFFWDRARRNAHSVDIRRLAPDWDGRLNRNRPHSSGGSNWVGLRLSGHSMRSRPGRVV